MIYMIDGDDNAGILVDDASDAKQPFGVARMFSTTWYSSLESAELVVRNIVNLTLLGIKRFGTTE